MRNLMLIFVIGLCFSLPTAAVEWTEFRGGNRQGVVEAKAVPVKIDFDHGVLWKTMLAGKGWSSPVMSEGLIVVTTAVGDPEVELRVIAVDEKSGKVVWEQMVFEPSEEEISSRHRKNGLASPSALISDGVIYAHFGHMGTAALELQSGKVIWRYHETYLPVHGNGGCPVLVNGTLVFSADGKEQALVRALDARTGKRRWQKNRGVETLRKFSFGTPLVIGEGEGALVISQGSEHVGAYRPENGELVWWVETGPGWSIVPRPILNQGMVYLATGFIRPSLLAIDPQGARGNVTKSHVKWKAKKHIPKTPSFVIKDGVIFLVEDSGWLSALNQDTGEHFWREPLKRNFSASPTLVGQHLYSFTEEGMGYVHEVSRQGAKLLAENDFGEPIFASPIIYDNTMIVRSETMLWKVGKAL